MFRVLGIYNFVGDVKSACKLGSANKDFMLLTKLYIPSTLNIDLILWHTQSIVCAENVKSWLKSWVFPFTFKAYVLPHTANIYRMVIDNFIGNPLLA